MEFWLCSTKPNLFYTASWIRTINTPVSEPFLSSGTLPAGDSDLMLSVTLPVLPRGLPALSHNSCKINTMYITMLNETFILNTYKDLKINTNHKHDNSIPLHLKCKTCRPYAHSVWSNAKQPYPHFIGRITFLMISMSSVALVFKFIYFK